MTEGITQYLADAIIGITTAIAGMREDEMSAGGIFGDGRRYVENGDYIQRTPEGYYWSIKFYRKVGYSGRTRGGAVEREAALNTFRFWLRAFLVIESKDSLARSVGVKAWPSGSPQALYTEGNTNGAD